MPVISLAAYVEGLFIVIANLSTLPGLLSWV